MSFAIATRAEVLKTKRSASVWLTIIGAGFMPALFLTAYLVKPESAQSAMQVAPWNVHFMLGWKAMNAFLFPMYVILICTLIPQIEYKNNTWKQVFASPQSIGSIFFSKFLIVQLMVLFFFLLFNTFMIGTAVITNIIHPKFQFFKQPPQWDRLLLLNVKTYLSVLGISAIQYALALRIKNFIAPIGIGLALLIGSLVTMQLGWKHIYKLPYAQPTLTLQYMSLKNRPALENHEWNAVVCCLLFLAIGLADMKLRREKG